MSEFGPVSQLFREISLKFFLNHVPAGAHVLDCGCGDGAVSIPLAEKGCQVDALDRDQSRLENVKQRAGNLPVQIHFADVLSAPFPQSTFDYVISRQFLPSFLNWRDVLRHQVSLCKVGGAVIMHHRSEDNAALCEQLARTTAAKAVVRRGYTKRYTASVSDLERFCIEQNCELEKLTPLSFFTPRAALWRISLNKEEREEYRIELEKRMSVPEVFEFMSWFESRIVAKAPASLSDGFLAVVRRSGLSRGNLNAGLDHGFQGDCSVEILAG